MKVDLWSKPVVNLLYIQHQHFPQIILFYDNIIHLRVFGSFDKYSFSSVLYLYIILNNFIVFKFLIDLYTFCRTVRGASLGSSIRFDFGSATIASYTCHGDWWYLPVNFCSCCGPNCGPFGVIRPSFLRARPLFRWWGRGEETLMV